MRTVNMAHGSFFLLAAYFAIEHLEWTVHRDTSFKKRHPGRITGHWESMRNVYLNAYFPLDPRQFWRLYGRNTSRPCITRSL